MATLDVALGPTLTADEAASIYARGREAVIFALLELAKGWGDAQGRRAAVSSPATPSGMTPVHLKPLRKTRGKKPGLAHLLRDLEHVEQYKHPTPQWPAFAKKLRRLVRDAIRLSQQLVRDGAGFRLAARANSQALGGSDRDALERLPGAATRQAPQTTSKRLVHLSRSSRDPIRQQPCRASHSPGRDHPQKQLLQPE